MNQLAILLIRFYKRWISPILPPSCRFTPSCSEYAVQAFQEYDFFTASFLSAKRILRCNPLFAAGDDPLPPNPKRK
ncbi:membrane protein insertion efficiency factor YidD [Leptospira langatensis]|uniref:Putative membrane protein insertion efficiency factor n=1 Tax=Leptospira langatensis TaxID=2484983 RepID=A0A5F1ZU21_9LEPT|nr:membrane protein insertion efficiency factor YidD [Leptospira langatensis]TGK03001.1 membrane protein insertion efficiency factor YidD [Leptospira langatensis]TGL41756.1 membrane protein insertion efficiency factor YidD [Leptospira langatensis]